MFSPYIAPENLLDRLRIIEQTTVFPAFWMLCIRFVWIVIVGSTVSSLAVWWIVYSEGGTYGGKDVTLSWFGSAFFLALGAVSGFAASFVPAVFFLLSAGSEQRDARKFWWVAILIAAMVCPAFGLAIKTMFYIVFFAMPDELFKVLYDV